MKAPLYTFDVRTHETGTPHRVTVKVFTSSADMRAYATNRYNADLPDKGSYEAAALFVGCAVPDWGQVPGRVGFILLNREHTSLASVAHECVHAAAHIYWLDLIEDDTLAIDHLSGQNETLAYLTGDLIQAVTSALHKRGFYDD